MTLEQMIEDTLRAADDYDPSSDLFSKVQRSINEDQAHRRRVRAWLIAVGASLLAIAAYLLVTVDVADGRITMPFTALEVLVTAVMIALVVVIGPSIRRFGETYERVVFAGSPETGRHVLRLLDIAYYLIFGAFTLMTLVYEPPVDAPQLQDWLSFEAQRLGGLLMMMGVLHVALLISLPVAGIVFNANQWRARVLDGMAATDPVARKIDRAVTIASWIVAGIILFEVVTGVLVAMAAIGAGG